MKGVWKDSEVKALFGEVEKCVKGGESLRKAFALHAKKYSRAEGSVRNYYYKEVSRFEKDKGRAKRLCINLENHEKAKFEYFSQEEESEFYNKIKAMVADGMSVRKACLTLAEGNGEKMLRYQNKYRALCKKNEKPMPNNIIRFSKKSNSITDVEIQALFAGLVRLVKRSAQEEAESRVKEREERANRELRRVIATLGERERELDELKNAFMGLKRENEKLMQGVRRNACLKAKVLKETSSKIENKNA